MAIYEFEPESIRSIRGYWGKSSFALVVDVNGRKLVQHWTSD